MIEVTLTRQMVEGLRGIADARNDGKSPEQSRKQSKKYSDALVDLMGVMGEYVTAKVYAVEWDTQSYGRGGDRGVDLLCPAPSAVKTNHRRDGYLIIERWSDVEKVQVMHLVDGTCRPPGYCQCGAGRTEETWRYVGWILTEEFRRVATETDWGLGTRFWCHQSKLNTRALWRGI